MCGVKVDVLMKYCRSFDFELCFCSPRSVGHLIFEGQFDCDVSLMVLWSDVAVLGELAAG